MPLPRFIGERVDVVAEDPGTDEGTAKLGGGGGGGTGNLPGSYTGGGLGGAGGPGGPRVGGGLPFLDWIKKASEKAGGVMGPAGQGMDALNMLGAPQQQAMATAEAGSRRGHERNQDLAWQSPEYQEWARQLWGGA